MALSTSCRPEYYADLEAGVLVTSSRRPVPLPAYYLCLFSCIVGAATLAFGAPSSALFVQPATTTVAQPIPTLLGTPQQQRLAPTVQAMGGIDPVAVPGAGSILSHSSLGSGSAMPQAISLLAAMAASLAGLLLYHRRPSPASHVAFAGLPNSSFQPPLPSSTALFAAAASIQPTSFQVGRYSLLGSVRKQNEDRSDVGKAGTTQFLGVYDGHGGNAVSEWLQTELRERVGRTFDPTRPQKSLNRAFLAADKAVLAPAKLFLGIPGERGIGGSKCGSTAVIALLYETEGVRRVAVANVGDARCLLIKKDGKAVQLTTDHVPDNEGERLRIESKNPNPKMPLVRFVGETWRVGGLLALSRAFGDAYLKSTGQFEGIGFLNSDYSSGFGVIAEPDMQVVDVQPDDAYLLLSSDGLYANVERGGGGGFENEQLGPFILGRAGKPLDEVAAALCKEAQSRGSTDDITVVLCKLG